MFAARTATVSLGILGYSRDAGGYRYLRVASYTVSKRLRELGIRVALGAQSIEVLQAALGKTFRILVTGAVAGLLLGMAATRVLSYIVYQATLRDPAVLAGVLLTMLLLGLAAAFVGLPRSGD